MENVEYIIFRELTDADFFHINKPRGVEEGGGGQSYIDIPVSAVGIDDWEDFFEGVPTQESTAGFPYWEFEINSLGVTDTQTLKIGQRRENSVSIRAQKLASRQSNRVHAWHPEYTDFPTPEHPEDQDSVNVYDLVIYIVRLEDGSYWAGWLHRSKPGKDWPINDKLDRLFEENAGIIEGDDDDIRFDKTDDEWPFRVAEPEVGEEEHAEEVEEDWYEEREEEEIIEELFEEDEAIDSGTSETRKAEIREVRRRNQKIVRLLKELYNGKCQVTGDEYTFRKPDGQYYSEAHHLIPLGEGGADSPYNLVILSPLIHKMLHYAEVEPIDLSEIEDNELTITINGEDYTIEWHPEHARLIEEAMEDDD